MRAQIVYTHISVFLIFDNIYRLVIGVNEYVENI